MLAIDATGSGGLDEVVDQAGLTGRFETLRLTTRSALDEYLKIYLKLPLSASRLGPLAKIFDYVSAAAPGVRELLVIGKVGWEVRNGDWDEIIVDAPATGHVVELLLAPSSMAELVPTGPLASQTDWLSDVLRAESTGVILVTTPEELPVTETEELLTRLRTETDTAVVGLVVNKMPRPVGAAGRAELVKNTAVANDAVAETAASGMAAVVELACFRDDSARAQLDRLAELLAGDDHIPTVMAFDEVKTPVEAVARGLDGADGW